MILIVLLLFSVLLASGLVWLDLWWRRKQALNTVTLADGTCMKIPSGEDPLLSYVRVVYDMFFGIRKPGSIDRLTDRAIRTSGSLKLCQGAMFTECAISIFDPDIARQVLFTKDSEMIKLQVTSDGSDVASLIIKDSILMAEGEYWKKHKQVLSPSFAYQHIQNILPEFLRIARLLESKWTATEGAIEIYSTIRSAALEAIGRGGFGRDFCLLDSEAPKDALASSYEKVAEELNNPVHFFVRLDKLLGTRKGMLEKLATFEQCIKGLMDEKRQAMSQPGWTATNILDLLLNAESSETLTNQQIYHNMNTFFIAGHETTASVIHSAIQYLSRHVECQDRLRQEILDLAPNGEFTYENIQSMKYLDCCLKETLRLMPPAPMIGRRAKIDQDVGPVHIAEGDVALIYIYNIQRDPEYWGGEADQFQPERFLPENRLKSSRNAYMPFSMGPRQCIGNNFANLEMKTFLAVLLRKFEFLSDPSCTAPFKSIMVPSFTMNPECHVVIKPCE